MSAPLLEVRGLQTHYHFRRQPDCEGCRERQLHSARGRDSGPRRRVRMRQDHHLPFNRRPAAAGRARRRRRDPPERVDLTKMSAREMRRVRGSAIGMILQDPMASLNPLFSIYTQVAEPAYYHLGMRRRSLRRRVEELLRSVRIPSPAMRMRGYPPDERRYAPAYSRRHRLGRRPEAHHRRRAHDQSRRHDPGPVSGPAHGHPAGNRRGADLRHAQPRHRRQDVRPHGGDVCGPDRRNGCGARPVQRAQASLHQGVARLHGQARSKEPLFAIPGQPPDLARRRRLRLSSAVAPTRCALCDTRPRGCRMRPELDGPMLAPAARSGVVHDRADA